VEVVLLTEPADTPARRHCSIRSRTAASRNTRRGVRARALLHPRPSPCQRRKTCYGVSTPSSWRITGSRPRHNDGVPSAPLPVGAPTPCRSESICFERGRPEALKPPSPSTPRRCPNPSRRSRRPPDDGTPPGGILKFWAATGRSRSRDRPTRRPSRLGEPVAQLREQRSRHFSRSDIVTLTLRLWSRRDELRSEAIERGWEEVEQLAGAHIAFSQYDWVSSTQPAPITG